MYQELFYLFMKTIIKTSVCFVILLAMVGCIAAVLVEKGCIKTTQPIIIENHQQPKIQ